MHHIMLLSLLLLLLIGRTIAAAASGRAVSLLPFSLIFGVFNGCRGQASTGSSSPGSSAGSQLQLPAESLTRDLHSKGDTSGCGSFYSFKGVISCAPSTSVARIFFFFCTESFFFLIYNISARMHVWVIGLRSLYVRSSIIVQYHAIFFALS